MITGIGSLPHVDVAEATSFALRTCPDLPAAPTLPARTPLEGMIVQGVWGMTGIAVGDGGQPMVTGRLNAEQPYADDQAAMPAGPPFEALHHFLAAAATTRPSRVKLQLAGPITLGVALVRAGVPMTQAFRTASAAVSERSRALLQIAAQQLPATGLVVFLDEPAFVGVGEKAFPLAVEDAIDLLSTALATLERGATTGVHCCGRADWGAILRAGPNILSLPVEHAGNLRSRDAAHLLDRGGWIAWGAVPTDRPLAVNADRYWRALNSRWRQLSDGGVDRERFANRAIITPACGLANHTVEQATRVFEFCREIAGRY